MGVIGSHAHHDVPLSFDQIIEKNKRKRTSIKYLLDRNTYGDMMSLLLMADFISWKTNLHIKGFYITILPRIYNKRVLIVYIQDMRFQKYVIIFNPKFP